MKKPMLLSWFSGICVYHCPKPLLPQREQKAAQRTRTKKFDDQRPKAICTNSERYLFGLINGSEGSSEHKVVRN